MFIVNWSIIKTNCIWSFTQAKYFSEVFTLIFILIKIISFADVRNTEHKTNIMCTFDIKIN